MHKRTRRAIATVSFFLAAIGGCTVREPVTVPDVSFADTGVLEASTSDGGRPDAPDAGRDVGPPPDASTEGLQCSGCLTDADCVGNSYCVELAAGGRVCLVACDAEIPDCPPRFDCVDSLLTSTPAPVCTPVGERCCVDADEDDRGDGVGCRGLDCDDDDADVYEGATETCNGTDDDCNGSVDEGNPGGSMVCSTGMSGACSSGTTTCTDGSVVCTPSAATTDEICNGLDDDCDSNVDEDDAGLTLTEACYDGPAGTAGVGGCMEGVRTCVGGMFRACVGAILPGTETCNGVDDNCNLTVDEGNPGGGFACSTPFGGPCSPGTTQCTGGSVMCVGTVLPGAMAEVCDSVDNDCDGLLNEGFSGLGSACFSGLGTCRRAGVTICNPASPASAPICDTPAGMPAAIEQCDYVDDDCDGTTDEGYRTAGGIYNTVAACGACGFDCNLGWPGGAASYNVSPTCTVTGGTARCGFSCIAGAFDADGVRDNGCEFFPELDTIYVSTPANGGADVSGCGNYTNPCASIGGGLMRATATGRVRVRVSTGLFVENFTMANGISVLGGHSATNWVRNPAIFATTIRGADSAVSVGTAADRIVVVAASITAATELSGFSIQGINASTGGNSIAIYVRDSDNDLLIQNNTIIAGPAGNGANGTVGGAGALGTAGAVGANPVRQACTSATIPSSAGGVRSCVATVVSGGSGGNAPSPTTSATTPTREGSGATGSTALGGAGGAGGYNLEGTTTGMGTRCIVVMSPSDATVGTAGTSGSDGTGGAGASSATGGITLSQWRGLRGSSGSAGVNGGGGGGGGTPGGVDATTYCLYPGTGGGGGSGGCAGTGGVGGAAGGASFAVFILFTTTPTVGAMPRILTNSLRRGDGGRGGDGGTGGGGGDGGLGGAGGPRTAGTTIGDTFEFCLSPGAPGGAGGRGGHAGGGGGGAGGVSFDIWVSRPGTAMPDYTGNTFEIPATTPTSGSGGVGGNSSNTAIGLGTAGVSGSFGTIRIGS